LVYTNLGLETGKARSGFGAKPEKQFLFWDLDVEKGNRLKVQGEVRYLKEAFINSSG
jgi:hypothetical protein